MKEECEIRDYPAAFWIKQRKKRGKQPDLVMMQLLLLVSHGPFSIWYFTLRWWAHSCTTSLPFKAPPFGSNFPLSSPRLSSLTSSLLPFNISLAGSEASYSFFLCLLSQAQTCGSSTLLLNWKGFFLFQAIIRLTV